MKKIIGIILAVLMIFSMSTMAFAGYESTPTPTKDYVQVDASLEVVTKPTDELALFNDSVVEPIKGRIFKVKFLITNETEEVIYADEILANFGISIVDSVTKEAVKLYTEAKDYGFDKVPAKVTIDPNDAPELLTYTIYAITDKAVAIRVIHEEKVYDLDEGAPTFYFVEKAEETTTTAPETTTETTTAAPIETTTTTTAPAVDEETGGYDEPDEPDYEYEVPEVDYEIPNTGSSKAVGAVAVLGVAAVAALIIAKKRKDIDE